MDTVHKLRRGGRNLPKSRKSTPELCVEYRRDAPNPSGLFDSSSRTLQSNQQNGNSQTELLSRLDGLTISAPAPSGGKKRTQGTQGTGTFLKINLFKLDYPDDLVLYDYKIKIEPNINGVNKDVRRVLFYLFEASQELAPFIHGLAHDNAQRLISVRALPPNLTATITFYEDNGGLEPRPTKRVFTFRVLGPKTLRAKDLSQYLDGYNPHYCPQPIISALNLILNSFPAHKGTRAGRKGFHFFPPNAPGCAMLLSANLEVWRAFYAPYTRLSDAIFTYSYRAPTLTNAMVFYTRARIITNYLGYGRRSRIKGFGSATARETLIAMESMGGELTIEQYFKQKYGVTLDHAGDLPVVNIGPDYQDVYVPAEICRVDSRQYFSGSLPKCASAILAKRTIESSRRLEELVMDSIHMLGIYTSQLVTEFGLTVAPFMTGVHGRVLRPPRLAYRSDLPIIVNGSWSTRGACFVSPARLMNPAIFVVCEEGSEGIHEEMELQLRLFIINFLSKCRSFGMNTGATLPSLHVLGACQGKDYGESRRGAIAVIEEKIMAMQDKPDLLFISFPRKRHYAYPGLKYICDVRLGIRSLCISIPGIDNPKGPSRWFSSLAMKLNVLLGGINHTLHPSSFRWLQDTMLVGIAINHLRLMGNRVSVAVVVASRDMAFVHYPASLSVQEHGKGAVLDLKHMMIDRLEEYRREMMDLPKRVIIFRTGAPDNQIKQMLEVEQPGIREAFKAFKAYSPKMTFITCTRGHRIRFYPCKNQNANAKVAAGTVVDRELTGTQEFCFYLQAQPALHDTSFSTRYRVIVDENDFRADILQQGLNDLCHLWPLAPRSVSMVPPALWARKACRRATIYLCEMGQIELETGGVDNVKFMERIKELWGTGIHPNLKRTMFYA